MANAVSKSVEKEALDQLKLLEQYAKSADDAILKLSSDALQLSKNVSGVKTPGGLSASASDNKALTDELSRQAKIIEGLETSLLSLQKVRANNNKLTAEESANQAILNRNAIQQAKLVSNLTGEYDKLSLKLLIAERGAKNIGATFGSSSKEFLTASKNVQVLRTEVGNIDRALGDNRRNVGNYTGGYNALGTSISRLAQELPNAGQSFQIFALSVGNNFAQVKDAIDGIVQKNKELKAAGEPTKSVISQIGASVFSLNTVFYIAIALFIAFSKEIATFTKRIFEGSKVNSGYAESIKKINEARIEGSKNAVKELVDLKNTLAIAKDVSLSYKERLIAVKELQDTYPFYFENLKKEQILAGDTAAAERLLTEAILSRAKSAAAISKITENQSKIIDLEEELRLEKEVVKERERSVKQQAELTVLNIKNSTRESTDLNATSRLRNAQDRLATSKARVARIQRDINELTETNNRLTAYSLIQEEKAIGLRYKPEKDGAKETRENIKQLSELRTENDGYLASLRGLVSVLEKTRDTFSRANPEYEKYNKQIKEVQFLIKTVTGFQDELNASSEKGIAILERKVAATNADIEANEALKRSVDDYIRSIPTDFIGSSQFGSLTQFVDGTFQRLFQNAETLKDKFAVTFQAIGEVAKDAFAYISQLGQAAFEQEAERLENQYNIASKFAGDNAAAQEEIDAQYERRRKELARERAKAERESAIFNAIINTAAGVVAALANPGGPAGIALAALVGILGAAQVATIASTPVPAFAKGGIHEKGGAMLVNDAPSGRYEETIVTPSGKVFKPKGRNVLMNVEAGSAIYTPEQWDSMQRMLGERGIMPYSAQMAIAARVNPKQLTEATVERAVSNAMQSAGSGNRESIELVLNHQALTMYIKRDNSRTKILNSNMRNKPIRYGK